MLFDNYELQTGVEEIENNHELREQDQFIDACMETRVMQEAHEFLVSEGKAPADPSKFRDLLIDIWFDFYSRSDSKR
jgi:poly(U)-specific endoribonuclease